jgi:hypothetical protein
MGMSRIEVNIDRIVLRGIDPADRQALVNGLQSELARILADPAARAAISQSRRTPVLRLGKISMGQGTAGARKLGGGIAQAIGKGMTR